MYYKNKRFNFSINFYLPYIFYHVSCTDKTYAQLYNTFRKNLQYNTQHDRKKFHEHIIHLKHAIQYDFTR